VIAAGVIEIVGGALLLAGRRVRAAALGLGATMAVAVYSSGILEGDVVPSLTLAPLLLAACAYLLVSPAAAERTRPDPGRSAPHG